MICGVFEIGWHLLLMPGPPLSGGLRTRSAHNLCFLSRQGLASAPFFLPLKELSLLMPAVRVRENEPFEVALRRFKRTCEKAGVLTDVRKKEFFEKPSMERKRKRAAAVKRQQKRVSRDVTRRTRMY